MISFLEELTFRIADARRQGTAETDTLEEWMEAVREAYTRLDVYNMSPPTVVETLFYRMRDAAATNPLGTSASAHDGGSIPGRKAAP